MKSIILVLSSIFAFTSFSPHRSLKTGTVNDPDPEVETHCVGRFLVDLPKGSQVSGSYTTAGTKVTTFSSVTPEAFEQRVNDRQQELQDAPHREGGTMFVDRDDISTHHVTLVSWSADVSRRVYHYDEYQYLPEAKVLYVFTGEGTANADSRKKAAAAQREYSDQIRYRKAQEIPEEHGFCICEGLIMGSTINREEMDIGFSFPQYPHVSISLMAFVTREDHDPEWHPGSHSMGFIGATVLREGVREWGGLKANELLVTYRDDGRWFYEFDLKIPSKGSTLEHPFIAFSMYAGSYEGTDDGKPVKSAFSSDKEALQLWDGVVGSLRLRHGAVAKDE